MIPEAKLRRIAKKAVLQGPSHKSNIIKFFGILIEAARDEFTEDNKVTLDHFLQECFDEALSFGSRS